MYYIIYFLLSISYFNQEEFLDTVTNDFDGRYTYFIALDIQSDSYNGKVVIQNKELSYYFKDRYNFDRNQYKDTIKEILKKKVIINLKDTRFNQYGFRIVARNDSIDHYASNGKDLFISQYFKEESVWWYQKNDIEQDFLYSIIERLFEFEIPIVKDCETGILIFYSRYYHKQ